MVYSTYRRVTMKEIVRRHRLTRCDSSEWPAKGDEGNLPSLNSNKEAKSRFQGISSWLADWSSRDRRGEDPAGGSSSRAMAMTEQYTSEGNEELMTRKRLLG